MNVEKKKRRIACLFVGVKGIMSMSLSNYKIEDIIHTVSPTLLHLSFLLNSSLSPNPFSFKFSFQIFATNQLVMDLYPYVDVICTHLHRIRYHWREELVSSRTLGSKWSGLWDPILIGKRNECQRGCWAPNWVDSKIPYRLERKTSVSEDVGLQMQWIMRSHIDWKGKRVSARTLGSKLSEFWDPTLIWKENKCQRGRWASNWVNSEIPHWFERETSVSKNAGLQMKWILKSHID